MLKKRQTTLVTAYTSFSNILLVVDTELSAYGAMRGYVRAKALLQDHFGNEQTVASAYMNKALSLPQI